MSIFSTVFAVQSAPKVLSPFVWSVHHLVTGSFGPTIIMTNKQTGDKIVGVNCTT